LVNLKFS